MASYGGRGVLAIAAAIVALVLAAQSVSAEGTLSGELPRTEAGGGVALVHWSGGSVDELSAVAEQQGCSVRSIWVAVDGRLIGYFVGAPDFVNVDWLGTLGAPEVGAGPLLLRCTTPELGSCTANETTLSHPSGTPGFATAEEAVRSGVKTLPDVPNGFIVGIVDSELGEGGLEESSWGLLTRDGLSIGVFVAVRTEAGWLMSTARYCVFS